MSKKQKINMETGEIENEKARLNELILRQTKRPNGSTRIQLDFSNCISVTDPSGAHDTDINHLMKKFKADELAMYIAARNPHRQEINDYDFSREPNLQEAKNQVYRLKQDWENLDPDVKRYFNTPMEFLKFIDNPSNAEKMLKMGLMTKREIEKITEPLRPTPQKENEEVKAD